MATSRKVIAHRSYVKNRDSILEHKRKFYYDNHARIREEQNKSRRERVAYRRAFVNRYKHMKGCMICGENDPACLDMHAPNGHDELCIGTMCTQAVKMSRLKDEMRKCVVLCSNCHRKLHAGHLKLSD